MGANTKRWAGVLACVWGMTGAAWAASAAERAPPCPERLRIGVPDVALGAQVHGEGEVFLEPPGRLVDAAKRSLGQLGCTAEFVRRPIKRLVVDLSGGELELALPMAASPERLALLRFPKGTDGLLDERLALFESPLLRLTLAAHHDAVLAQFQPPTALPQSLSYGALRGSVGWELLTRLNLKRQEAADVPRALTMLRLGRYDVLVLPEVIVPRDALGGSAPIVPVGPPLDWQRYFVAASPGLAEQHSGWLQAFWRLSCQASRSVPSRLPACP